MARISVVFKKKKNRTQNLIFRAHALTFFKILFDTFGITFCFLSSSSCSLFPKAFLKLEFTRRGFKLFDIGFSHTVYVGLYRTFWLAKSAVSQSVDQLQSVLQINNKQHVFSNVGWQRSSGFQRVCCDTGWRVWRTYRGYDPQTVLAHYGQTVDCLHVRII